MSNLVSQADEKERGQLRHKRYSSDLSENEWRHIASLITIHRVGKWPLEEIVNGIFYWLKNSCIWSDLPGDFPPWQTVLYHFRKWTTDGTWQKIDAYLTNRYGERVPYRKKERKSCSRVIFDLSWMKENGPAAHITVAHASTAST